MPNVLIVDDSPVDRQLFEGILSKKLGISYFHAGDGVEALHKIGEWQIDLVITDLQMPNMDGLELVQTIREEHPAIPTILVTGVGSEEIATRALDAGAASYVPKDKAYQLLLPTVQSVLDILFEEHSFALLLEKATETRFEFALDNDEKYFPPIFELCDRMLESLSPLDQIERLRCCVAVEQALNNALYRGNLEIDRDSVYQSVSSNANGLADLVKQRKKEHQNRNIYVGIEIESFGFTCRVRDQGPGFRPSNVTGITSHSGRGLTMMRMFMDNVEFNRMGNEVTLNRSWKTRESSWIDDDEDLLLATDSNPLNLGVFCCMDSDLKVEMCHPSQLVGHEATCHVLLKDPDVSAHHCELSFRKGVWSVKALAGNEVWINGQPAEQGRLLPSDRLRVGQHEYQIDYEVGEE